MSAKKSFFITLRIFLVLFSLQFIKDAFYKWDGYSYYIPFRDFLPDLSLAFILWTILPLTFAVIMWIIMYGLPQILPTPIKVVRFEHIAAFFILVVIPIFIKKFILDFIPISSVIGSSQIIRLIIGSVFVFIAIGLVCKYAEKILYGFHNGIKPIFWLFIALLIIAVPLSGFKKEHPKGKSLTYDKHVSLPDNKKPNIILVTMDALTARDMQVYGYNRPTTPFMSEWAKNAIVFKRAYASSNWTTPAIMSLMTGQRPWTHKAWHLRYNYPISNYEKSLPKILKEHGYAVYSFVQNIFAHPEILGLGEVFEVKDRAHTFWISPSWLVDKSVRFYVSRPIVAEWIFENNPYVKPLNIKIFRSPIYITSILSETVYNRFLDYLIKNSRQPFFAWIHVFPPHVLYLPPPPYMGMFGDADKFNTPEKQLNSNLIYAYYQPKRQGDVDILRKRYNEFILYSDHQFKLFLTRLFETIDMSKTIIILSSDHGESFSHGYCGHDQFDLYEPLVHVPLIIKLPNIEEGKIIDVAVEQTDIAPTILELAGVSIPEWMEGRSLLPLLYGKTINPRPIFSMQLIKNRVIGNHSITKGTIAVWDGEYKLIYYLEDRKSLLFNLRDDPDETQNIFHERPETAQRLMTLIEDNLFLANKKILHIR